DPFDWVELRAVRRERHQGEVGRPVGWPELVPSGAIEHHDGVDVFGQGAGEGVEEQPGGARGDLRQDEGEVVAGGRTGGAEDVGPLVAPVAQTRRTLATQPPAMADPALVADAGLVLEPQLQALGGMRLGHRRQGRAEPLFWRRYYTCRTQADEVG